MAVSEMMIEADAGELEALRVAIRPVAHLDDCERIVAAALDGRIPADDFVTAAVRSARDTLVSDLREHRLNCTAGEIAYANRRLINLEHLLRHLHAARRRRSSEDCRSTSFGTRVRWSHRQMWVA
jgi:hypothetical protein